MAIGLLRRLAAEAPIPVFGAIGVGGESLISGLACEPGISLARSVRHAAILLIAGEVPVEDRNALCRLHDQMPHPRATVWWDGTPFKGFSNAVQVSARDQLALRLRSLFADLLSGACPSEPDLLPNEPPCPWRGRGENGQGGDGMMGGTPYGRPMAMTMADVRDGLELDAFTMIVGPFLPMLPPGLQLELTLQGDLVQSAKVLRPPYYEDTTHGCDQQRAVGLRRAARLLELLELAAMARRCRRIADTRQWEMLPSLRRMVALSGALAAIPRGLGTYLGSDVRERMMRALEAVSGVGRPNESDTADGCRLVDLLAGLEWGEAMLVISSFDDATLLRIAPVRAEEPQAHEGYH